MVPVPEMSMLSDEPLDLDNVSSETAKVSALIFVLRSAFQRKEFNKVEEILIARENRQSKELQEWKKKYESMENMHGMATLNNINAENEMGKCRCQLDMLTEQVTRLQEDNRLLSNEAVVHEEREKRAQAKFEKVLEVNERIMKENRELVVKILEFESERVKAEKELKNVRKKNDELELRIERIEEVADMLDNPPKVEEAKDSNDDDIANRTHIGTISANSTGAEVKEVILNGHEKWSDSVDTNGNRLKREVSGFGIHPCNEGQTVVERGDSSRRDKRQKTVTADGKTKSGVVIDISDSDDETPTRNQTPNVPNIALPNGGNKYTSGSQKQRGSTYLGIGVRENCLKKYGFSLSSSSSESCDSDTIFELVKQRRGSS